MGGLALARVLFGDSRDVFSSSSGYSGDPSAIRSFTDGPFGMGSGIIMSTGSLTSGSLAPGGTCLSSYTTDLYDAYTATYCGPDSYNGASFLLNVLPTKATTLLIDMVIASCDVISGDKVMVFVNGVNVAKDETGTPLDSSSKYLSEPWGIPSPNGDTVFAMSSPPLRFSIPLPKTYVELKIAVCDRHDGYGDTAVMIKARPCTNCDQTFKVDYDTTSIVSTTTYEATSVVTQAASGTVRGTISYLTYVTASATSTTLLSSTTSTESTFVATSTSPAMSTSGDATSSVSEISTLTDTATSSDFTPSASSEPISCNQISNPYQGSSNSQFGVVCNSYATGGNNIGPSHEVTGLAPCIDLCSTTSNCKVALFDRSQYLCYLLDGTDGPAANNLYDMATLLSSTSSTAMSSATFSTTTTSAISAPTPCNQLENPSYINGVKLSLLCGKQATGGNQIDYSNQLHSLTECMTLCADTLACRAVTFNNVGNECTLYDGVNGFMSDFNMDMAVVASRPATSSTTEAPTAFSTTTSLSTTSTTAPSGPRSCSQMAGSTYTGPNENKFTLSCDTSSTGESIYRRDEEDSMQGCLDRCDNDSRIHLRVYSINTRHNLFSVDINRVPRNYIIIVIIRTHVRDYVSGYTGVAIIYDYISCNLTSRYLITNKIVTIYIIIVIIRCSIRDYIEPCIGVYARVYITFNCVSYNLTSSYLIINNIYTLYITRSFIILVVRSCLGVCTEYQIRIYISWRVIFSRVYYTSGFSITKTTSQTRLPTSFPTPTAIHTAYSTLIVDHVYTKTQFAETVTTVTYTTINPSNPTALITTCVPITLLYSPCGCEHQVYPSVDMATVACTQGEDIVTLTVPKAAYETGRASDTHPIVQYPSGWAGGNSNPVVQPTEGPQGGSQHGSKNVPPETPTRATGSRDDSHPSYKVHQPATTTSATGSNGDTQPAQGNTRPSVPAQGSPESNSNTPMNPSQPSSPKSLTTETSTIPTPQLDTSAIPSQSSPLHQDQVPSEPADAPYATPMVVSEARGYSLPSWIAITAIVGMALLL
ncbi:hypothetical protein FOBRF1_003029 [Fusarium oxysporum]